MDYFAPLSFDSTFGRVYHVFQKRWKDFLAISLLVYFSGLLFAILTNLLMGNDLKIDGFSIQPQYTVYLSDGQAQNSSESGLEGWPLAIYLIEALIYYCFSCIAHGATVWLATHLYLEQYPSILDGLSNAGTKVIALTWSLVIIAMIATVPCFIIVAVMGQGGPIVVAIVLVCILFAVIQTIFYHVYPAIMVENVGPLTALSRSYEISSGHRCFIFGILFVWGCCRSIIGLLIGLIAQSGYQRELTFNEDYMAYDVAVSYGWQYYVAQVLDTGLGILFLTLESV